MIRCRYSEGGDDIKKLFVAVCIIIAISFNCAAFAIEFDIEPFMNNEQYIVDFDDNDDFIIAFKAEEKIMMGVYGDLDGMCTGMFYVLSFDDHPPIILLEIVCEYKNWTDINKVSFKPTDTTYTLNVLFSDETDVSKSTMFAFSDESIAMLEDIVSNYVLLSEYTLSGERIYSGNMMIDVDKIAQLLEDYKASGALSNDFSKIKELFVCTIE